MDSLVMSKIFYNNLISLAENLRHEFLPIVEREREREREYLF